MKGANQLYGHRRVYIIKMKVLIKCEMCGKWNSNGKRCSNCTKNLASKIITKIIKAIERKHKK